MKIDAGAYEKFMDMDNDTNRNLIDDNVEIKKQKMVNDDKDDERRFKATQAEKDRQTKLTIEKLKAANKSKTTT
jgi:hypothetical protein